MQSPVHKVIELVGSSPDSVEDAIQTAIGRAGKTMRNLLWFEVVQIRGYIESGAASKYQVVLKVGFSLEGP
jgi:flavin-binding protein dodecin